MKESSLLINLHDAIKSKVRLCDGVAAIQVEDNSIVYDFSLSENATRRETSLRVVKSSIQGIQKLQARVITQGEVTIAECVQHPSDIDYAGSEEIELEISITDTGEEVETEKKAIICSKPVRTIRKEELSTWIPVLLTVLNE